MDYSTVVDAIRFASNYDDSISIGGGEPTIHPRFFDILDFALRGFNFVWMATNGSQTKAMYRLANIIDGCDYESFDCNCSEENLEEYGCECDHPYIQQEGKLSVALSQDSFHDPIDERIVKLWSNRARKHEHSHFEIRNVAASWRSIAGQGRAKKNGYTDEHCVCDSIIIKPDGKLRLCGCTRSPVIGDIWSGIEDKWQKVIEDNKGYQGTNCYKSITK